MIAGAQQAQSRAGKAPARAKRLSHYEKIVIVTRETELEALTRRFNTTAQAKFYLEHAGQAFTPIEQRHIQYHAVLDQVRTAIPKGTKSQIIERALVPQYTFGEGDFVITVGPDGLVVNVAKYLQHQPIFAVNPDPASIEGVLLPFTAQMLEQNLLPALQAQAQIKPVTMAKATHNDGQELLAFNDLFVGARSHVSARYEIAQGDQHERQSSSGIIISTGAGSTGWLKSVYAGAVGVINALGGHVDMPKDNGRFDWVEDRLVYAVREPWPSKASGAKMSFGVITPDNPLRLTSYMSDIGVVFSDGVEKDYLDFNAGHRIEIGIAEHKAILIGG